MKPRLVIARFANGGIGDHLSCLIGAWWFARRTGRTLVIDWRGSRFNGDSAHRRNCFADLFEACDTLCGVPVICDDRVAGMAAVGPFYPAKWTAENLAGTAHVPHTASEIEAVNRLVTSTEDRPEPVVCFNQWIEPAPPRQAVRELLDELRFATPIRHAASAIWDAHVGQRPAVAIHIRHGNGENIGMRAAYWLDAVRWTRQLCMNGATDVHRPGTHGRFGDNMPESLIRSRDLVGSERAFLRRIRTMATAIQSTLDGAEVMLFTDSPAAAACYRALAPDVIVPPKTFLAPESGPLHAIVRERWDISGDPGIDRVSFEMAVEMELMRRCSGLVYMESGFSIFPRVLLPDSHVRLIRPTLLNRVIQSLFFRLDMPRRLRAWQARRAPSAGSGTEAAESSTPAAWMDPAADLRDAHEAPGAPRLPAAQTPVPDRPAPPAPMAQRGETRAEPAVTADGSEP